MASNNDGWEDVPLTTEEKQVPVAAAPSVTPAADGWEDVPVSSSTNPTMLDAIVNSGIQGATFEFGDELYGAGAAIIDKLKGSDKSLLDLYKKNAEAKRDDFKRSEEEFPITSLVSNVGGGIITGSAFLKAVQALGLAKNLVHAPEAYKALSGVDKIKNATKVGAIAGGVTGAGTSEADLTQGEVGQFAEDVALNTALGAGVGGLMQGAVEGGKKLSQIVSNHSAPISEIGVVRDAKTALKSGYNKETLIGETAVRKAENVYNDTIETMGNLVENSQTKIGKKLGDFLEIKKNAVDLTDDVKTTLRQALDEIKDVPAKSDLEINEKERITKALTQLLEGKTVDVTHEVKTKRFFPNSMEKIPATSSAREKLEEDLLKKRLRAKAEGVNLRTNIIEEIDEQGRKWLIPQATVDEQIEAAERLVRVPGEEIVQEVAPSDYKKVRFSTKANSDKDKANAKAALAKLTATAKIEGKDVAYELIDDKQNGIYQIVEKGKKANKPIVSRTPDEFMLDDTGTAENFKSKVSTGMPVLDVAATPEQTREIPGGFKEEILKFIKTQQEGAPTGDLKDTDNIKRSLQHMIRHQDIKGAHAGHMDSIMKKAANNLKKITETPFENTPQVWDNGIDLETNIIRKGTGELRTHNPLAQLRQQYADIEKARELFSELATKGDSNAATTSGMKARDVVDKFMTHYKNAVNPLGNLDKMGALHMGETFKDAATKLDLVHKINSDKGIGFFGTARGIGLAKLNWAGLVARDVADATPEQVKQLGSLIAKVGSKTHQSLGAAFNQMAMKDQKGRNATLFALMQNPTYRQILEDLYSDKNETKEDKK
jgi:hypothetical protein